MKDDIRKYLPDLATVLRETEPKRIKERRDKAVEGFKEGPSGAPANEVEPESSPRAVQRAGAEAEAGAGAAETGAGAVETGAAGTETGAVETASPWMKGAPVAVPKEVLPSSLAPAEEEAPGAAIPKGAAAAAAGSGQAQKKKWPRWAPTVLAVLAVVVPLVLLWLAMRPKGAREGPEVVPAAESASAPAAASSVEEVPAPSASATEAPAAVTAASSATAPEVDAGTPGAALAPRSPSSVRPPRLPAPSSPAQVPTSSASAPKAPENPFDKPNFD